MNLKFNIILTLSLFAFAANANFLSYKRDDSYVLQAFKEVSKMTNKFVVKIKENDSVIALGTLAGKEGFVLTKASLIRNKDTQKLKVLMDATNDQFAKIDSISIDRKTDLALIKLNGTFNIDPNWESSFPKMGSYVVSPSMEKLPHAVGVVSLRARKIEQHRGMIGVRFTGGNSTPKIIEVMEDSPADTAGLLPGDLIYQVDDTATKSVQDVIREVGKNHPGSTILLKVSRGENDLELRLTLGREDSIIPHLSESLKMAGVLSQKRSGFEQVIEHDSTLTKVNEMGGPLVNLDGKIIGINIARASRVAIYALPYEIVQQAIRRMKTNLE